MTTPADDPSRLGNLAWYALPAQDAAGQMSVDPDDGLGAYQAENRLHTIEAILVATLG